MSGTRAVSTTSRRELSSSFFFLQGKAPKEIHDILTEILACFFPGRAKDLSAPLYKLIVFDIGLRLKRVDKHRWKKEKGEEKENARDRKQQ